jgi:protein HOOK3
VSAFLKTATSVLIYKENVSQKSEDNLAVAESDLDKQTNIAVDLSRKVEELQGKAEEAARLKDQLDE